MLMVAAWSRPRHYAQYLSSNETLAKAEQMADDPKNPGYFDIGGHLPEDQLFLFLFNPSGDFGHLSTGPHTAAKKIAACAPAMLSETAGAASQAAWASWRAAVGHPPWLTERRLLWEQMQKELDEVPDEHRGTRFDAGWQPGDDDWFFVNSSRPDGIDVDNARISAWDPAWDATWHAEWAKLSGIAWQAGCDSWTEEQTTPERLVADAKQRMWESGPSWADDWIPTDAVQGTMFRIERRHQAHLIREIAGNPFRRSELAHSGITSPSSAIRELARAAYEARQPDRTLEPARLAALADAMETAGPFPPVLLEHLRSSGPHVRGCWAVDLILADQ